jgi:hypothetical protein
MQPEVIEDRISPGMWRVESVNYELDGEVYLAAFSGPTAEQQAKAYAAFAPTDREEMLEQIEDHMDLPEVRKQLNEPTISWAEVKKELGL